MTTTEETLKREIIELSDYDAAAEALNQLKHLNRELTENLTLDIIRNNKGDEYFQAFAFQTLYSLNIQKGIQLIKNPPEHLNTATLDAMIECTTVDSGIAADHPEVLEAAKILKETIRNLDAEKSHRMKDTIDWFLETYQNI
ncbi:hypothetical protein [Ectopseudomonas khazarica]|uniref:hypothetical protein n=1 Tax=Ectopseudomonas khazarica TaxID=2502979 RepID=UPI003B935E47